MSEPALQLRDVQRRFAQGGGGLHVLRGASLRLERGEAVALVGPSGAGKSTLLHVAGLLEPPDSGEVLVDGEDGARLGDAGRTLIRRRKLGFVYQFHHLLPEFSALENVIVPQMIAGTSRAVAARRAAELLERVGLSARASHRPGRLSGGEQQRVAIVRAIANAPRVLLADEPTGNLDPSTAGIVFAELIRLVRDTGLAVLMATHNPELAARMDRTLRLEDGVLVSA
jgi:lipoprotein-releasing system ATP-binding protein